MKTVTNNRDLTRRFKLYGYTIIPKLFNKQEVTQFRSIGERIFTRWLELFPDYRLKPKTKNISNSTTLDYFDNHQSQ